MFRPHEVRPHPLMELGVKGVMLDTLVLGCTRRAVYVFSGVRAPKPACSSNKLHWIMFCYLCTYLYPTPLIIKHDKISPFQGQFLITRQKSGMVMAIFGGMIANTIKGVPERFGQGSVTVAMNTVATTLDVKTDRS